MKKMAEIKEELGVITNDTKRLQYFYNLVSEFDEQGKRNDRKHFRKERRSDYDITNMDSSYDPDNLDTYIPPKLTEICNAYNWDEIIFTDDSEDIYQLISDRALSYVVNKLKPAQKEVFFDRVVKGYTAMEISVNRGVSDRYVRKLYEKAIEHIQKEYLAVIKFKRKLETEEKYKEIASERNVFTIEQERRFLAEYESNIKEGEKFNDIIILGEIEKIS